MYVTKLDLLKGYWQVALSPRAKEIWAFVTPDTFFQYKVMPFGVRNAPATYQLVANLALSRLSGCKAYLDGIVVNSKSCDNHIKQLSVMFNRLHDARVTLNLAKCVFSQATVTLSGKIIGRGQVQMVHAKVEAILSVPAPASWRELHRFLGMAGYYRYFCKNFSAVTVLFMDQLSLKTCFH